MTMDEFVKSDLHSALFSDSDVQNGQIASYDLKRDKANLNQISQPGQQAPNEQAPAENELAQLNQFLNSVMTEVASTRSGMKRFALLETGDSTPDWSKTVLPSEYGYQPGAPPPGYSALGIKGRAPRPIEDAAKQVLHTFLADRSNHPIGTMVPFMVDGNQYMARAEVHSNSPYGISVYKADSSSGIQGRRKILERINNAPEGSPGDELEELNKFLSDVEKEA